MISEATTKLLADMLGADGFVFLDDRPWPFAVKRHESGNWWMYYWADGAKEFVSMKELDVETVERYRPHALPQEKAAFYFSFSKPANELLRDK